MKHLIDQKPNRRRRLTWHFSSAILNCFSPNACLASFISCFTSLDIVQNIHRWLVYLRRLVIGYKFEVMMLNFVNKANETNDRWFDTYEILFGIQLRRKQKFEIFRFYTVHILLTLFKKNTLPRYFNYIILSVICRFQVIYFCFI